MTGKYKIKNDTVAPIFWWIGTNAFPSTGPIKPNEVSENLNYFQNWGYMSIINDNTKTVICTVAFPSEGNWLITILRVNEYTLTRQ